MKSIDPTTGRPFGDHGTHVDALDYVAEGRARDEVETFINDWQAGDLTEWPDYYIWLAKRPVEPAPRTFGRGLVGGAAAMFLAMYLGTGLAMGLGMQRNLPAMNAAGVAYYALTWPAFVSAGCFGTPAPHVPRWAFTFTGPTS